MSWNYVDEMFFSKTQSTTYYILLTCLCCLGNIAGALLADFLSKRWRSLRQVAALGTLLSAPMVFMFWMLLKRSAAGQAITNTHYLGVAICGFLESVGEGMLLVGAFAYVCKQATGLSSGRRFGSVVLVWQFTYYLDDLWLYLGLKNSNFYIMWGGVACVLCAVAWTQMPEESQLVGRHGPWTETKRYMDLLRGILVFVPFAALGTGMEWGCEYVVEQLNLHSHVTVLAASLMVASGIGASILFGWGLDSNPTRMMRIWLMAGVAAMVCFIATDYGIFETMAIFTVMFTWITYVAIFVLMVSFITHHERNNEIAAIAAWMSVWFMGGLLTFLAMKLTRSKVVNLFYLGVMTLVSGVLVMTRDWHVDTMKNVPASPTYKQQLD
jgi:hypothetical protein